MRFFDMFAVSWRDVEFCNLVFFYYFMCFFHYIFYHSNPHKYTLDTCAVFDTLQVSHGNSKRWWNFVTMFALQFD